jgi:hypothetical protein
MNGALQLDGIAMSYAADLAQRCEPALDLIESG